MSSRLYVSYCFSRPRGRKRDEGFSTAETKVFTEPQARSKSWVEAVEKPEWAFFCPEDYSKSSENTIFHHTQRFFTLFCPRIHFSALGLQNLTRPGLKNLFSLSWFRKNAERDEKVLLLSNIEVPSILGSELASSEPRRRWGCWNWANIADV